MSKELLVESTCAGCPFAHTDVDFDAIGYEYYHTCNLAKFLGISPYCTGISTDDEDYFYGDKGILNNPEEGIQEIEWCPLKKEKEITIKFKQK